MRSLRVLSLLLIAVTAAACGQPTGTVAAPKPGESPTSASNGTAPVDACQYVTQADAASMLGEDVDAGVPHSVTEYDNHCSFSAANPSHGAIGISIYTGPDVDGVLTDYKTTYPDAQPVPGYPYPALHTTKSFVAKSDARGCTVSTLMKTPPNVEAFLARSGEICRKVLAGQIY
jgi:hypothetical protein